MWRHVREELATLGSVNTLLVLGFAVFCFLVVELPAKHTLHMRETPVQAIVVDGETVYIKDLQLDHAYVSDLDQRCPVWLLLLLCLLVPSSAALFGIARPRKPGDAVAFVHGFLLAMTCMEVTINMVKNYCGYLRPYFYEECDFDLAKGECQKDISDAHKSFPSGHAGYSFAAMLYVSLYLLGKVNAASPRLLSLGDHGPLLDCTNALLLLSLAPLAIAGWVAASRVVDNDHHPADVATGAAIGAAWASFWYGRYYPSIWAEQSDVPSMHAAPAGAEPIPEEPEQETLSALMGV